jgi:hypothetical protein
MNRRIGSTLAGSAALLGTVGCLLGCTCASPRGQEGKASASAAPSASSPPPIRQEDLPEELRVATAWPIPTGIQLEILPGQGVGPIRLGATVATIERLMDAPCEFKTDDACRYVSRGVEFLLKDGVTHEIRAHRMNRPTTPKGRVYGVFNGKMRVGVAFVMLPTAVREFLGPPSKIEPVKDGGEAHTEEIHHYDGLRIEFDRLSNGNLVVGGMNIVRRDAAAR